MEKHSIREESRNTPSHFMLQNKLRPDGPLGSYGDLTLTVPTNFYLHLFFLQWCTCQLKYACSALDTAFADLMTYLQRSCKNHAALPVVSAVRSRTMYLLEVVTTDNKPSLPGNKSPMFMEAVRRKTFSSWPHKEYRYRALIKF